MYRKFYNLKEKPFNVTADPNFLFFSRRHKEAFAHLLYGINERKGFLEITGEIGTGKTTLCRALLNQLDAQTKAAFILNSNLSEVQLLEAIIEDFGISPQRRSKIGLLNDLNSFLLEQLSHGHNVVLIIDEAQNLKPDLLEQVRMLSNLETEKEKLFQIVLVGQPELRHKLNNPSLKQLRQRICVRYHILPLDENEIMDYINHRLRVAGSNDSVHFTQSAIDAIYGYSWGIPRVINLVCDKALLLGYTLEQRTISDNIIKKAVNEVEGISGGQS